MLASRRCFGPLRLALLLAGFPLALAAEPIHVTGRVLIPAEPPQGLAGARVELLPQTGETPILTAKSDAAGLFELVAPESGCFRVRVRAEGYLNVENPLLPLVEGTDLPLVPAFSASDPRAQGLAGPQAFEGWIFGAQTPKAVQPSPATPPRLVQGKVSDPKGAPVSGALVWSEGSPAVPCVRTGADGTFQIRLSAGGEAKLQATAAGYLPSDPRPAPPSGRQGPPLVLALEPAGSITGRVVDAADQPLGKVQIAALPLQLIGGGPPRIGMAWSRADGRFRLPLLTPGQVYEVTAVQEGFAPASVKTDALPRGRSPRPVRIVLERGATVLGKILDPEGKPVRDAELTLTLSQETRFSQGLSWNGQSLGKGTSDATGSFALSHLLPGRFHLAVKRKGFAPLSLPEVEVPAKTARVDLGALTLERGAAVEGRVADPAGVPLPEAEVELTRARDQLAAVFSDSESFGVAKTDAEGRFRFEDLRRGARFDLGVNHPGHVPAAVRAVEAPTQEPLRIELKTGRTLAGRVRNPEGKPVPQAEIFLQTGPEAGPRQLGTADEDGRFRFAGIQPGTVALAVQAPGYQLARLQDLRIPEESDVEGLEITLRKGSMLEVQVLDSRRQPVAGAWVMAHAEDFEPVPVHRGPARCETDDAGHCRLEGLSLGLYDVFALSVRHGQVRAKVEIAPGANQRELVFPAGVKISGRVSDETGAPVAGAGLSLNSVGPGESLETASLADGSFQFPTVSDGIYRLSGAAPGFAEAALPEEVQVAGQEIGGLALRLSRGATLTGKLLGLEPEELGAATVNAFRMTEGVSFTHPFLSRTDREGRYKITDLAPGDWRISAQARGRSVQESLQIAPGVREAVLDLRFSTGFTISGRVTMDGAPLAGAQVWVSSTGASFQGQTGPEGGFQIPNVLAGRYTLTATDQGGSGTSVNVEITGDQEVNLDFSTGGLRVRALASGAPVANAFVSLSGRVPFFGRGRPMTDAAGSFEAPRIASGKYTVFVQKEGFAPAQVEVEVHPGAVTAVEIELKPVQ
ncbi:MAG: carboxypeptidase regulatory-like domain-containing protein [Thermoanaerobaculia bacterium]